MVVQPKSSIISISIAFIVLMSKALWPMFSITYFINKGLISSYFVERNMATVPIR